MEPVTTALHVSHGDGLWGIEPAEGVNLWSL